MRGKASRVESFRRLGLVAVTRNLIAFCYPRQTGHWRAWARHLRARWQQFDGIKAIAVAYDDSTDDLGDVQAELPDESIRWHYGPNTPLQEVQPLAWLLESVERAPGITLYCHAKGASHADPASASHVWRDAMAEACLDYPQLVNCALEDAATCGAFRSTQPIGHSPSPWHFAGTWWWVRNDALFRRNWGDFEQVFWGAESYPGRHFGIHESRCLLFDGAQTAHLYSGAWWRDYIGPAIHNWRAALRRCGQVPIGVDVVNTDQYNEWTA